MATASERNQALLNNRTWQTKDFREQQDKIPPVMPNVNLQDNINVALRDPVYGQGTATGLAAGQSMLNSWIGAANAIAKKEADKLASERWIKAQDDLVNEREENKRRWEAEAAESKRRFGILQKGAEEDRKLKRDELAESKQVFVPRMDLPERNVWLSPEARPEDVKRRSALATLGKARVAKNAIEAQALQNSQSEALKEYQDWLSQQQRDLIPRETDPLAGKDISKTDLVSDFELLNSQGTRSSGGLIDRILRNSTFQNKAARQFESMGGSRNTVRYDNLAQYANNLVAAGNPDGARKLNQLKSGLARQGDRIIEIVGSDDATMPVYIRTNRGVYQMLPTGEVEPTQFTVE